MADEEVTCNSTKRKSKPELKADENLEFQQKDLFWRLDTEAPSRMGKNRQDDGGKPQKHKQQFKGKKKYLRQYKIFKAYFSRDLFAAPKAAVLTRQKNEQMGKDSEADEVDIHYGRSCCWPQRAAPWFWPPRAPPVKIYTTTNTVTCQCSDKTSYRLQWGWWLGSGRFRGRRGLFGFLHLYEPCFT